MNKMKAFVGCWLFVGSTVTVACVGAGDPTIQALENNDVAVQADHNQGNQQQQQGNDDGTNSSKSVTGVSSPYVVGEWQFKQQGNGCPTNPSTKVIADTEFQFINPTPGTFTLEYAFFGMNGEFCGCDIDTLDPNDTVRYTMAQERAGGQFSLSLCPNERSGAMKAIVFTGTKNGKPVLDDALQVGFQVFAFDKDGVQEPATGSDDFILGKTMTQAPLQGITINKLTIQEINQIFTQCAGFTPVPPSQC